MPLLRRAAIVLGLALLAPAPAHASSPRDGLATADDAPGFALVRTVVHGPRATAVLRARPRLLTSRAVATRSAAAARLAARRLAKRGARTWHEGVLAGSVLVRGGPTGQRAAIARQAVAAIRARLREAARRTPWEQATALGPGGRVSTRQAARVFSMAFERLPGVPAPAGTIDQPQDGTLALEWALARRRSMTAAQRAIVERWARRLHGAAAAGGHTAALEADWTEDAGLTAEAQVQAGVLAAKLKLPALASELHVGSTAHLPEAPGAMMVTESVAADGDPSSGKPVSCWITVYHAGAVQAGTYRAELFAHEVFHCFQAQLAGELDRLADRFANGTTWWVEGGADWAACNAVPAALPEPALTGWLTTPRLTLAKRAYDGVGFFTLLSGYGVDVWGRWPAIARTTSTAGAYDAAVGTGHDIIRRGWGASFLGDAARGAAWDLDRSQPCLPAPSQLEPKDLFIADGETAALTADAYAARLYTLLSDADVIHFTVADDDVRLSSSNPALDTSALHDRYFCTDLQSDCHCPAPSARAGKPPPPRVDPDGGTVLAVTGGRSGVKGTLSGLTREQYCAIRFGLIVPGKSIGDAYLGQTRKSVLRAIDGLKPTERGTTTRTANGLLLGGGGLIGILYQVRFGVCSTPALEAAPGAGAACRSQFPQSHADQVAAVQTSGEQFATKGGLGPGSDADAVVARYGDQYCEREEGDGPPEQRPWLQCRVPSGSGMTTWGFTVTKAGANIVQAVAVFNPKAIGD